MSSVNLENTPRPAADRFLVLLKTRGPQTTAEDTPLNNIVVLTNDTDVDGDTLTVSGTPTALHGTVTVNPDGTLNYTPTANYNGADTITYTVTDGSATDIGTVAVNVTAVDPSGNRGWAVSEIMAIDSRAPSVVGQIPLSGSTGISTATNVMATFDEASVSSS